jgi:hypothetical protein
MNEGWSASDYLAVCESDEEIQRLTSAYDVSSRLPGFRFVGMKGWDDLVVSDSSGQLFTNPAVPMIPAYLAPAPSLAAAIRSSEVRCLTFIDNQDQHTL